MRVSLGQILADTEATLPALKARRAELERRALAAPLPTDFRRLFTAARVALIAEVKRRSPSAGAINTALDPGSWATRYADAGAAAISVLTDGPHFGGSLADLEEVAQAVPTPVLRKDFILAEEQVLEARLAGASAVLLIVRALSRSRLASLQRFAADLGLAALVEAHTAAEVQVSLEVEARIVGVNSRDLDTFAIDTTRAWELFQLVPPGITAIAESGLAAANDVIRAAEAGADAVLIGTALSASPDPGKLARELSSVARHGR